MNKVLLLMFMSLFIIAGCNSNSDNQVTVELDEQSMLISGLDFTISGQVKGLKQNYFFYQIEDGHGFLSEGKIDVQKNGTFKTSLTIKSPTNEFGELRFYSDANGNGVFDVELDTEQSLASYELTFHKSIVIPLSKNKDMNESQKEDTEIVTTLYTINLNDYKNRNVSEIPFYSLGKIEYITEKTVKSFQEGHHPWLGHAETFISIKASNLVPAAYKKDDEIKKEFIQIKKRTDNSAVATIKFDDNFFCEVTAESSEITGGIFFITNIDFHTHIKEQ